MATRGIHPKWISCFPGGVYRYDDGVTPDPEEDDFHSHGLIFYEPDGTVTKEYFKTHEEYLARKADIDAASEPKTLKDVLTELGF